MKSRFPRTTAFTRIRIAIYFLLLLIVSRQTARAQRLSAPGHIERIAAPGMVVSDMDRSVAPHSQVPTFEKVLDVEVFGDDYEHLEGLFGIRMRVVRLGAESIELKEVLTPQGRPMPVDSRGNDRWFQHIAIIVSDMDRA